MYVYLPGIYACPVPIKTSFMFKCAEEDGDVRIEAFIQKTFDWYCKAVENTEDHFRYLYSLVLTDPPSTFPGGMVGIEQPIGKRRWDLSLLYLT